MARPISDNSLYRKVEQDLRLAIEAGRMDPGAKLPDERSLSEQYAVSRTTIRQALSKLMESRLIDRVPGRNGIYVTYQSRQVRYLHLVVLSHQKWLDVYTAIIMAQAEQSAKRIGWRLCLHRVADLAGAGRVVTEINNDPLAVGGLLEGCFTPDEVVTLTAASRLPWVILSDLVESVRSNPVLHQVICDPFSTAQQATRCLVESGCRNPALFVFYQKILWSQEAISAFRSVLDASGIPAEKQQIFDLAALRPTQQPMTAEDNTQYNAVAMRQVIAHWKQTDRWPDGVIFPGGDVKVLEICTRQDEQARRQLQNIHLVLASAEELREMLGHCYLPWRTSWVLAPVAKMTDTAVSLIQEHRISPDMPRRKYIREVSVLENTAFSKTPEEYDAAAASLVIV